MTAQTPEAPAATDTNGSVEPAPLTFQAPPPAAPGRPNPIPPWPWGKPITPATPPATTDQEN